MAFLVGQRTREIGIRMALGATPGGILALVVRQGMSIALTGVGLGLCGAVIVTRFMTSLLYGVRARDPLTFGAIAVTLGTVALVASYIPARRAANVDPIAALRSE
jgi:putative ABC transport system permease protein